MEIGASDLGILVICNQHKMIGRAVVSWMFL